MTNLTSRLRLATLVVAVLLAAAHPVSAAVTMQLDRAQMGTDDAAQLTVQSSGTDGASVNPPSVPGLQFNSVGQSSQIEIVNGAMTATSSVTYEVTAKAPGNYSIPVPGGKALQLQVTSGSSAANSSPTSLTAAPPGLGLPSAPLTAPPPGSPNLMADGSAFVRMVLPKHELYVGETVPVDIQVGIRSGLSATLNGLPTLDADAFTLNKLSNKPEQTQEEIDGQPFTLLTWHSLLAPIKPGDFSLALETPVTVRVRSHAQMPGFDDNNSPFGSAFIQNFFGTVPQKDITLKNDPDSVKILPLPSAGKPGDFSGAVGKFSATSDISAATAAQGDPLTLHFKVGGTGSFDRVTSSVLAAGSDWKTYRPTEKFTPEDSVGYSGEKVFEQAVVPLASGKITVPALSFSYFNPESRQYEVATAPSLSVDVTPSSSAPVIATTAPVASPPPPAASPASPSHVASDVMTEGLSLASSLGSLMTQSWFILGEVLLILAFLLSWLWLRLRDRQSRDLQRIRHREQWRKVAVCLKEMTAATAQRDTRAFFLSARAALQHTLALRWNLAPEAITSHEIATRLRTGDEPIRQVFALADEIAYAGHSPEAADLQSWDATVRHTIKEMELA